MHRLPDTTKFYISSSAPNSGIATNLNEGYNELVWTMAMSPSMSFKAPLLYYSPPVQRTAQ